MPTPVGRRIRHDFQVSRSSVHFQTHIDSVLHSRHPTELYKNGIQRASFLPAIDLLQQRFVVVDLDSGTDYRRIPRALQKVYFHPLTPENCSELDKIFHAFTAGDGKLVTDRELHIWGRKLLVPESSDNVARFSFDDLCGRPLSAADYLEVTRRFRTVFVTEIPKMGLGQKDLARRFITFVDGTSSWLSYGTLLTPARSMLRKSHETVCYFRGAHLSGILRRRKCHAVPRVRPRSGCHGRPRSLRPADRPDVHFLWRGRTFRICQGVLAVGADGHERVGRSCWTDHGRGVRAVTPQHHKNRCSLARFLTHALHFTLMYWIYIYIFGWWIGIA